MTKGTMVSEAQHSAELNRLGAQRARLADRLTTPWWYLAGMGVVLILTCATPFAARYAGGHYNFSSLAAIAVFALLQAGLDRATGVSLGRRTLQYPSGRPAGIALMVVIVAAVVAEIILLDRRLPVPALITGIVAVVIGVICWRAHITGIRRDLRAGTGAA